MVHPPVIAERFPLVEAVVVLPFVEERRGAPANEAGGAPGPRRGGPDLAATGVPGAVSWEGVLAAGGAPPGEAGELRIPDYTRLPFDHPLATRGTSGPPGTWPDSPSRIRRLRRDRRFKGSLGVGGNEGWGFWRGKRRTRG